MRWALFISLAVNLLLIGAAVGVGLGEWRLQKERATAAVARAPNMGAVLQALPPERASEVRGKVADAWRGAKDERGEARAAREEIARIVAADTYDRAAAGAAFARMRAADARVAARFHDVVADAMASMTAEERRALLRQLLTRRSQRAHGAGGEPRRGALQQLPPEERRALMREAIEERREVLRNETPEARRERLKEGREEWRRRREEQSGPPSPSP
jgi:uncharacterized membrane protein